MNGIQKIQTLEAGTGTLTGLGDGVTPVTLNPGDTWTLQYAGLNPGATLAVLRSHTEYPPVYVPVAQVATDGTLNYTHTVTASEAGTHQDLSYYMLFPNTFVGYQDPNAPTGFRYVDVANLGYDVTGTPVAAPPPQPVSPAPPLTSVPAASVAAPAAPAPAVAETSALPAPAQINPQILAPSSVVPSATMIQYTSDFQGVTYLDASGATVTVLYTDGQHFNDLVVIRSAQIAALAANQSAKNAYNLSVQNAQISVTTGRPAPVLPTAPLQEIVANDGTVTYQPFPAGTLQVLVPLVVNAPNSGQIKTTVNVPADPVAQQAAAQTVMMAKIDAIIAALQAKGIM
jgi:hypothetical protein